MLYLNTDWSVGHGWQKQVMSVSHYRYEAWDQCKLQCRGQGPYPYADSRRSALESALESSDSGSELANSNANATVGM